MRPSRSRTKLRIFGTKKSSHNFVSSKKTLVMKCVQFRPTEMIYQAQILGSQKKVLSFCSK